MSNEPTQNISGKHIENPTQIEHLNIHYHGLTKEQAIQLFDERLQHALSNYSIEAVNVGKSRGQFLIQLLLEKVAKHEELLQHFSDPSVQITLGKALYAAAATERKSDYEILSELILKRIQEPQNRKNSAAITKAIEIISEIDTDALHALTALHCICGFQPTYAIDHHGWLIGLDQLYQAITQVPLPSDDSWIDHLQLLGTLTVPPFNNHQPLIKYIVNSAPLLFTYGLKIGSPNHAKALKLLSPLSLTNLMLVGNSLFPDAVRVPAIIQEKDKNLNFTMIGNQNGHRITLPSTASDQVDTILKDIIKLYDTNPSAPTTIETSLKREIETLPHIKQIQEWWNKLPFTPVPTHLGRIIAQVNLKRIRPDIPNLPHMQI